MTISEFHASHIREVNVGFVISAPELDPDQVTELTGLSADKSARRGDERRNPRGVLLRPEEEGWWRVDSSPRLKVTGIRTKDINEHLHVLLEVLLPHRIGLLDLACEGETYFDVLWQSTYLYAGTGPLLTEESLAGIAALEAGMGFDIYQVDEDAG